MTPRSTDKFTKRRERKKGALISPFAAAGTQSPKLTVTEMMGENEAENTLGGTSIYQFVGKGLHSRGRTMERRTNDDKASNSY